MTAALFVSIRGGLIMRKMLYVLCIFSIIISFSCANICNASAEKSKNSIIDTIKEEQKKIEENNPEIKPGESVTDKTRQGRAALDEKSKKDGITVDTKELLVGTIRSTGVMYLPILLTLSIAIFLMGKLSEALKFLVKTAGTMFIMAILGYILIFFADPIVQFIIDVKM